MKQLSLHNLFRPRTPEARRAFDQFNERVKARLQIINRIPLTILVWGPSLKAVGQVAEKRKDIYLRLLECGHNAIMSEELPASEHMVSLRTYELAQAHEAHLIIILVEDAAGALAEAEDFALHPNVASKVFVMAPESYKEGYSGKGTFLLLDNGFGGVYWYHRDDIPKCNVLGRALLRAQARREMYASYLAAGDHGL